MDFPSPIIMKGSIRNIVFSYLLLTITFAQLTFHTLHVLTSHTHEDTIELNSSDLVHDASTTCELCAKLSTATFFLPTVEFSTQKGHFPKIKFYSPTTYFNSEKYLLPHLRGPPQA